MDPQTLSAIISKLDPDVPLHKKLEVALRIGPQYGNAKYKNQKHHWLSWLATYDDPLCACRQYRSRTDAELVYNRLNCPPMVFWLAEALGAPQPALREAIDAALNAPKNQASQTASVRSCLPWSILKGLISAHSQRRDFSNSHQMYRHHPKVDPE